VFCFSVEVIERSFCKWNSRSCYFHFLSSSLFDASCPSFI